MPRASLSFRCPWKQKQLRNGGTEQMDSYPLPGVPYRLVCNMARQPCRQFINGSCRCGQHCYFVHEWQPVPSVQVCRYFQKGGCWFGENCRYLHIPCTTVESGVRRGSVPVVHYSALSGPALTGHRVFATRGVHGSRRRASEPLVTSFLSHQQNLQHVSGDIAEEEENVVAEVGPVIHQQDQACQLEQSDHAGPSLSHSSDSCGSLSNAAAVDQDQTTSVTDKQESSLQDGLESGATASAEQEEMEAYNQSKDVVCGICMDKVYDKPTARERRFGILPNCNHAFCISCIMTWRKTKEFEEDVVKSCPHCRVKSSFYIPSNFWICEDEPKAALISSFKQKCSKLSCNFFIRYGYCPFESECIFSHDLPSGHRPQYGHFKIGTEMLDQPVWSYLVSMTVSDDDDDVIEEIEIY